jgi:penicillin-binding protein 1A
MLIMLRAVINEGTGGRVRRVYNITADMGGKTGTTNNNSDGWFMGFTPTLVSGAWVGGEERDIHFDNMTDGQGAAMALLLTEVIVCGGMMFYGGRFLRIKA